MPVLRSLFSRSRFDARPHRAAFARRSRFLGKCRRRLPSLQSAQGQSIAGGVRSGVAGAAVSAQSGGISRAGQQSPHIARPGGFSQQTVFAQLPLADAGESVLRGIKRARLRALFFFALLLERFPRTTCQKIFSNNFSRTTTSCCSRGYSPLPSALHWVTRWPSARRAITGRKNSPRIWPCCKRSWMPANSW